MAVDCKELFLMLNAEQIETRVNEFCKFLEDNNVPHLMGYVAKDGNKVLATVKGAGNAEHYLGILKALNSALTETLG